MRLADLKRNDVRGALAYLRQRLDAGTFTSDDGQVLLSLQDDPAELSREVTKLVAERRREGKPLGPFAD